MKIDKNRDLLLIVDMQNDFCPGGALGIAGAEALVPGINGMIRCFEHVATTQDWHPPEHISFQSQGGPWPCHCVRDTQGAALHKDLKLPANVLSIYKATQKEEEAYSGFEGTELAEALEKRKIARIFICGLTSDFCVKHTAADALEAGYEVVVFRDLVRGIDVNPGDSQRALEDIVFRGGAVLSSSDLC